MPDILMPIFTVQQTRLMTLGLAIMESNLTHDVKEDLGEVFRTIEAQLKEYSRLGWV